MLPSRSPALPTPAQAKFKCVFRDHGLGLEGLQEACKGAKLYLANVKQFITKIFKIMRIESHLAIFTTEEEALQAIKDS